MLLLLLEQLILINITAHSSVGRASDCSCYNFRRVASSNLAGRIYIYDNMLPKGSGFKPAGDKLLAIV